MGKFRFLFAWLLMAALPLQGFAATSMLFCGMERMTMSQTSSGSRTAYEPNDRADVVMQDIAVSMDSQIQTMAGPDAGTMAQVHHKMQGHGCSVCAFSCQLVVIALIDRVPNASSPLSIEPEHPVVRVVTRSTSVPEKPPRV